MKGFMIYVGSEIRSCGCKHGVRETASLKSLQEGWMLWV